MSGESGVCPKQLKSLFFALLTRRSLLLHVSASLTADRFCVRPFCLPGVRLLPTRRRAHGDMPAEKRLKGLTGYLQQCRPLNSTAGVQHLPGPGSQAALKPLLQHPAVAVIGGPQAAQEWCRR
jgi:hypothetical protein